MDKELEKKFKEVTDMLICQYCWDEGCIKLFGTDDLNLDMVRERVSSIGMARLIEKAIWSFSCPTDKGYDAWLHSKIKLEDLPPRISFDTFVERFKIQLTALYQKDKKENAEKANG